MQKAEQRAFLGTMVGNVRVRSPAALAGVWRQNDGDNGEAVVEEVEVDDDEGEGMRPSTVPGRRDLPAASPGRPPANPHTRPGAPRHFPCTPFPSPFSLSRPPSFWRLVRLDEIYPPAFQIILLQLPPSSSPLFLGK